jgi:predicted dinucleotide-binding enzyme
MASLPVRDPVGDHLLTPQNSALVPTEGELADAKADVVALFQDAGFAAIDLGELATGGAMQQIHHPLAGVNLIRLQRPARGTRSAAKPTQPKGDPP